MIKPINSVQATVMVWLTSYLFFLVTLANNFSASHDSINYLLHIVRGEHLLHQHHLLYNFIAHGWLNMLQPIFPSLAPHYLIESFTALWGSGILSIAFLFLRHRFNLATDLSVLGILLIAFSFGMWFYSVNVEVYMPPLFMILCCLYVMTRQQAKNADVVAVAIFHSIAILFHQVNVLFLPVAIYWIYARKVNLNLTRSFVTYLLLLVLISGGVYFLVGWFVEGHRSFGNLIRWTLGYTAGNNYWQVLTSKTPLAVLTGFARTFIGGHFIFQHSFLENFAQNAFRSHTLKDEFFLSQNISSTLTWVLIVLSIAFISAIVAMTIMFVSRFKHTRMHYHVIGPLLACIGIYSLFFCFWMPEILEFWILQMVLAWLLLIGALPVYARFHKLSLRSLLAALAITLFVINYFGSIKWLRQLKNDLYYVEVQKLDPTLTPHDLVIVEDEWILKDYVRYYSKAYVIATDDPQFNENAARELVNRTLSANRKVYVYRKPGAWGEIGRWESIQSY
jgi:hypothetical protein